MRSFEETAWVEAAEERFERALKKSADKLKKRAALEKLEAEKKAIDGLRVVVEWCSARSLDVSFGKEKNGVYLPTEQKITISGRASPEKQLFYLLHECGHFLIEKCSSHETKKNRWGTFEDPGVGWTSVRYRVEIVDEELEAWKRGEKLAERLGIEIDTRTFTRVKAESIISYMKWAVRAHGGSGKASKT